ncbi:hypothetical protein HA402_006557, partial [Bradysia odoriphaga]
MASKGYVSVDTGNGKRPLNPSTLSKVFLCWVFPYLRTGRTKNLQLSDVNEISNENAAETIAERITAVWFEEHKKSSPKLITCLISNFLPFFAFATFLSIVKDCVFRVAQGPALGILIDAFSRSEHFGLEQAIYAGGGLVVALVLFTILHHYAIFLLFELGMKIRVAVTMLIYDKALRLSQFSLGETSVSQIINLLTNDANRFDRGTPYLPYLIVAPLQIVSATGVLWIYLGPSCLALPILLLLLVPFQSWVGKMFGKFRDAAAKKTDNRIRIINEAINGIQMIKMCAYENVFFKKVIRARKAELQVISKTWMFDALNKSIFDVASKLMIMLTLLLYILVPNSVVDVATVFITLTLANYVRNAITNFLPMAVTSLFELRVSINRIETFLLLDEKENVSFNQNSTDKHGISMKDFTARWTKDGQPVVLNATIDVQPGKLTAVIGSVASGKTSLIHGILGELLAETGTVNVKGSVSYAPQEAWLFSGTIRDNILAGQKLDHEWYAEVVDACSLTQDIDMFPEGDQTFVGEKGMVLSGGQKARINLARAVYRNADIYLLDDPLSAVDVRVAKRLYENCICGTLKSKTVVLVTHNLNLLSANESSVQAVVLKDGRVAAFGSFAEVKQHLDWEVKSNFEVDQHDKEIKTSKKVDAAAPTGVIDKPNSDKTGKKDGRTEAQTEGTISWSLHHKYFSAGNGWSMFLFFLLATLATQIFISGSDYWLKVWSATESRRDVNVGNEWLITWNTTYNLELNTSNDKTQTLSGRSDLQDNDRYFYVGIYGAIIAGIFVASILRNFALVFWTMSSSRKLHNNLFMSLVRAPMNFFEKNSM